MQATEALELPTDVPGHVRPFPTKQLKCQPLQRSTRHPQERSTDIHPVHRIFCCDIGARLTCANSGQIATWRPFGARFSGSSRDHPACRL